MIVTEEIADWDDFKWNYAYSDTKRVCEMVDENELGDEAWSWLEEIANVNADSGTPMSLTELNDIVRFDEEFDSSFVNVKSDDDVSNDDDFEY